MESFSSQKINQLFRYRCSFESLRLEKLKGRLFYRITVLNILKMDQWPFIVLIISAVLFSRTNPAIGAPAGIYWIEIQLFWVNYQQVSFIKLESNTLNSAGLNYIAPYPWESGFSAAVDALANGVSIFGKLVSTAASKAVDSTTHGAGMLLSGTLGNRMVNINTRHFSDMYG